MKCKVKSETYRNDDHNSCHIRTLQCTEPYNLRNRHSVSNVLGSRGPLNPQIRTCYIGNLHTVLKDTDLRNAQGTSRIAVGYLALVAELCGGASRYGGSTAYRKWQPGLYGALAYAMIQPGTEYVLHWHTQCTGRGGRIAGEADQPGLSLADRQLWGWHTSCNLLASIDHLPMALGFHHYISIYGALADSANQYGNLLDWCCLCGQDPVSEFDGIQHLFSGPQGRARRDGTSINMEHGIQEDFYMISSNGIWGSPRWRTTG